MREILVGVFDVVIGFLLGILVLLFIVFVLPFTLLRAIVRPEEPEDSPEV